MPHRFRFVLVLTLAAAIVAVACGGGGSKTGSLTLRLGHDQSDGHPFDAAAKRFASGVAESSGGAITVTVFPAAQLGDSPEQVEGLRLGSLDLALVAFSHASQFCPELGLFGAPFLFENPAHFAAVFDGAIGDELDRACRDRYGIRLLATLTSGDRVFFNGRRAITSVADLAGLKVRVMGGEADALTWQAFGAVPVPMPYSEMYSALQAGVIDGAENEPASILRNRFYEAAANIAETRHLVLPLGLFVSRQTMDRLTPDQQAMLLDQARQAVRWERATMAEQNAAALKTMQEKFGAKLTTPDTAALREKGRQVQERVAEKLGQQALLAKVRAAAR